MHLTIAFSNCLPIPQGSLYLRSDAVSAAPAPPRNQMRPLSSTLEPAWYIDLHQTTRRHIPVERILHMLRSYVYCLRQPSLPWLWRLVVSLSRRRSWYDLGAINVEFLVDRLLLGQVSPSEYFGFSHSVSFHQCSTLILPFNSGDILRRHVTHQRYRRWRYYRAEESSSPICISRRPL